MTMHTGPPHGPGWLSSVWVDKRSVNYPGSGYRFQVVDVEVAEGRRSFAFFADLVFVADPI